MEPRDDAVRAAGTGGLVRLNADVRLGDLERVLADVRRRPGADLQVPYKLRHRGLLVSASVCQVVLTWSRGGPGRLRTHWKEGAGGLEDQVDRLVSSDHGLVAVLASQDVLDVNGRASVRPAARAAANDRLARMDSADPAVALGRGRESVALVCDDGGGRGAPRSLYAVRGGFVQPRGEEDFADLASALLRLRLKDRAAAGAVLPDRAAERRLAVLLRETFWNTDDWGRSDADGRSLVRGVRMVRAEWHTGGSASLVPDPAREPRLTAWLDAAAPEGTVLELSVLDCGPGLAARRLRETGHDPEHAPVGTERDALLHCMRKGYTSARETAGRGLGLDSTLRTLTSTRGLFRVRTGRLDLYCDTVATPYDGTALLSDWATGGAELRDRPRAAGTLVSMLVPLAGDGRA